MAFSATGKNVDAFCAIRKVLVATTLTASSEYAFKISRNRANDPNAICIACSVRKPLPSRPAARRIGSRTLFTIRIESPSCAPICRRKLLDPKSIAANICSFIVTVPLGTEYQTRDDKGLPLPHYDAGSLTAKKPW
jgi:hypothetical protein